MATEARAGKKPPKRKPPKQLRTPAGQAAPSKLDPETISDRTTVGVFYRQAERFQDRPMLYRHQEGEWRPVSWGELREMVLRAAGRLIDAGVATGDHVVLMSENRLEWLVADLAIQSAGAVSVPIYPSTVDKVAQGIVDDCRAVLAIVSGSDSEATLKVSGTLRRLVHMDGEFGDWISTPSDGGPGPVIQRLEALKPDDVVTLIYTSGTTGQPKGVVLAHRNFVDMARATLQVFDVGEHDVSLSFLPYSHVFERMSGIFVGIMGGGSSYLSRGIDLLGEDLGQVKPTLMMSVPRVYEKMYARVQQQVGNAPPHKQALFRWAIATGKRSLKGRANPLQGIQQRLAERIVLAPLRQRLSGGRLRFFVSGGAPLNPEIEEFFWAIGIPILQGWGLTETTSGATSNTEKDHRLGTVGKAFPGVELKIAGDGEILVKGPGVMLGYHDSPKATAEVLEDGWFRSGDIGELDKAGFLKITDRKKDLLKTAGGKYVAPQPIESRLQDDSLIERAVLIGDGRPYVTALIVPDWEALKREQKLSGEPEQLSQDEKVRAVFQGRVDAVNKGLGSWETIKYFQLLAEDFSEARGEMTPTLKVRRRAVQEHHKAAIESMYQDKEKPGKAQRKSEQGARRNG